MHHVQDESKVERKLEEFKAAYETRAASFYKYFQKEWVAACKYKLWIATYRGDECPTTTGALEAYHGVIKLLFTSTRCVARVLQSGFYNQGFTIRVLQRAATACSAARSRRRRMANRRLDWLVYTIMRHIVPYFVRNNARNNHDKDERDKMAYVHAMQAAQVSAEAEAAVAEEADCAYTPASEEVQVVAAPREQLWRAENTAADIVALRAQVLEAHAAARAAGKGMAALADEKESLQRLLLKMQMTTAGTSSAEALLPNPGDNHQTRSDPRALGGTGGKKRRADGDGRGAAPKRKLLPNNPTRTKAPKQLRKQLEATPQPADAE
jgi:hypothetical protein